ncbi:MAG: hypothetical protein H7175_11215 [Burkholderiales bacterium]|nr:hypothetical protein [Anaerolineae bacterium]
MDYIETLREQIQKWSRYFRVTQLDVQFRDVFEGTKELEIVDAYVESLDLYALGKKWRKVDYQRAHEILSWFMHNDIVSNRGLMPLKEAEEFSTAFAKIFSANARCYTNADWKYFCYNWILLTDKGYLEFENGKAVTYQEYCVIFLDDVFIGLIWSQSRYD